MYVSYLLDKDPAMYQTPPRHAPGLNLNPQNFVPTAPQYPDFAGYHHHVPGINNETHPGQNGGWCPAYTPAPRDDWSAHYAHPGAPASANPASNTAAVGPGLGFSPAEFPGQPAALLPAHLNPTAGQMSPGSPQRRNPYDWIRRNSAPASNSNGKTRTKDKYRVVYTDHQRLELEKEFHYSRYITIRRKAELASALSLSERQVKIWFQNRRAKERKVNKKKLQQPASSTTTPPHGNQHNNNSSNNSNGSIAMVTSSSGMVSPSSLPMTIKEEY